MCALIAATLLRGLCYHYCNKAALNYNSNIVLFVFVCKSVSLYWLLLFRCRSVYIMTCSCHLYAGQLFSIECYLSFWLMSYLNQNSVYFTVSMLGCILARTLKWLSFTEQSGFFISEYTANICRYALVLLRCV